MLLSVRSLEQCLTSGVPCPCWPWSPLGSSLSSGCSPWVGRRRLCLQRGERPLGDTQGRAGFLEEEAVG